MLPFLAKKKQIAGVIMKRREPDVKDDGSPAEEYHELEGACQDMLEAIRMEDPKALAKAIKTAFEVADSYPHHEGEHIDEDQMPGEGA